MPTRKKNEKDIRVRFYCITLTNPFSFDILGEPDRAKEEFEKHVRYLVIGHEFGKGQQQRQEDDERSTSETEADKKEDDRYEHWQCYIELRRAQRLPFLRRL